jgi:hypothetical protein
MALRAVACVTSILSLMVPAFADDIIYNGLHCNSFCQSWMGVGTERWSQKRRCAQIVSHSAQYDDDLVKLCKYVSGRPYH